MALSGISWVSKFPTSRDVEDLISPFRENVKRFLQALTDAGCSITISATYRPKERAYLMHYAYRIAREGLSPLSVPALSGVDIQWDHRKSNGQLDQTASRNAAEDMVLGYGIAFRPALNSNHTRKLAIDMTLSWSGTLKVKNAGGKIVSISSTPRTGQNSDLVKVGASYQVIKLQSDPPHWSSDGHLRAGGKRKRSDRC